MKEISPLIVLLLFIAGCSSKPATITVSKTPLPGLKTPDLLLPKDSDKTMKNAAMIFRLYANSDEFYKFARSRIHDLDGGNAKNIDRAVDKYRHCLDTMGPVRIEYKRYAVENQRKVIGGWRETYLAQNPLKQLNVIERSGHWVHELTHACGFIHISNDIVEYPIIKQSWPYQVGYAFEDFLKEKMK